VARRLDHAEVLRRHRGAQAAETADFREANERQNDRASQQHERLHQLRIDHSGQAADDRVNACRNDQCDRRRQRIPADHTLQHDRRRIQMHGNLREDVREDRDAGEVHAARAVEAPLQELGHREHVRAQVERHEDPAEDQQDQTRQPFEVTDREARSRPRAREADEMLGGNIRDEQRGADGEPADVASREEVVDRAAALAREIHADAEDDDEVDRDDADVEPGEALGRDHGCGGGAGHQSSFFS
jgi:hypothetical protein